MTGKTILPLWLACALPLSTASAQCLPAAGSFTAGTGAIAMSGQTLTISQSTPRGIIDWPSFSIAPGSTVIFNNGNGATLNRVTSPLPSSLAGSLAATGSIYLINPNGIVITPTGKILTGGTFLAATRDVPDAAFMSGAPLAFTGTAAGAVTNAGIITSQAGSVILIGASTANNGMISARNGTATLAAANRVILAPGSGPPGLYVAPDAAAAGTVTNTGTIRAAAAALTAAGGNVYALAGNQSGLIQASAAGQIGGQVWLTAPNGNVTIGASIRASAASGGTIIAAGRITSLGPGANLAATGAGGAGGTILAGITAPGGAHESRETRIANGAMLSTGAGGRIETSGSSLTLGHAAITPGPGGLWLLDPQRLTIGPAAAATIDAALNAGANVTQQTSGPAQGAGDITVVAPISWSSAATLSLSAFAGIDIAAAITITGNGGLSLTTGNDAGGQSPQDAALNFSNGGAISYTAGADTNPAPLTINGVPYTLIFNAAQLQALAPTAEAALAQNLDLSGIAFTPLAQKGFSGSFNGLGNVIANLAITDTTDNDIGLFGVITLAGSVENLGLVGGATIGGGGLFSFVGALAGINEGSLRHDFATGPVSAASPHAIGGLVGANAGLIAQSYATGPVTAAGAGTGDIGGLVGATEPNGLIQDVYATGAVTGAPYSLAGGLAGLNFETTIEDAYATGAVTSGNTGGNTGGLVANDQAGSYVDTYYDTTATGGTAGPGTGLTTASWLTQGPLVPGSPNSFINPAAWRQGGPYPVLAALPYVTLTESAAQTYGGALTASVPGVTGQNAAGIDLAGFRVLTATGPGTGIGSYAIGGTGAADPGIQIDYTGTLTITPAPLTITAASGLSTYGQTPALTGGYTAQGLVNGDTLGSVALTTDASAANNVGDYLITPSAATGAALENYAITYIPGTLTILPAPLIITASGQAKQVGETIDLGATAFTATGLRNGDSVATVTLTSAGAVADASLAGAPYAIIANGAAGRGLANYTITYRPGRLAITALAAAPQNAALLPDGNVIPSDLLLAAGPAGNNQPALPQIIATEDAAGLATTPTGLMLSTGLPLAGQANTLSLLASRARHLAVRLPRAKAGGF